MDSAKDLKKRKETLKKEIERKDWFDAIIKHIEILEVIYSDHRIKGYVRDAHEFTVKEYIKNYLDKDSGLRELAEDYWTQIKVEGERKRIKGVEKNLKNLELILGKEAVSLETKERLINRAEEEINTQVPEEIREIYLEMASWMKEKYLTKNE